MKLQMLIKFVCVLLLFTGLKSAWAGELTTLKYITESYPPYNFKEGDKLQGIAVDLLVAATVAAGDPLSVDSIRVLPWPRAYMLAQKEAGTVLFSTTRTEQREPLFQWVGPIASTRVVLMARKADNIVINNADDISRYMVGAILDDIGEQLLKSAGVADSAIKIIPSADALAKMLGAGRIQLWAYEENVARWYIKQSKLDNTQFEVVHVLKESDLYYTLNNNIPAATVQRLQEGVNKIRNDNAAYQKILDRYL
ncbi:MAG: transporter substrate-binding domain-containing protein [Saccharospirillaceae bacterium]|nr:transporter substrate-binding domain-containing protein [Saccharospirillaceae bacterium]